MRSATILIVLGLLVTACSDGTDVGDDRADQARTAALDAGLDADVADFLALAARGQTATYQATYPGPDAGTSVVVANRPPDRRVDVVADDLIVQVQISLDGVGYTCPRDEEAGEIVSCERTDAIVEPPGAFGTAAMDSLSASLADRIDDFDFTLETSAIAGVEARCLVTNVKSGRERAELADSGTICVSPEGALLRVAQGDEVIEATDYTTEIPDNTFVRPDTGGDN
ncbi:hypothetical protein [Actinospongicola halichondriae]|uniref:hypothetical protein n=1 Tax=Actinospongicola halichondriae TaxID=3236844 RepID=UPI003D464374